jgi:hypothetical protein
MSIVTSEEEIISAVWGWRHVVHPPEMCDGEPLVLNLYHDSPNSLLLDAVKTTHPWTGKIDHGNCPEITDIRVAHQRDQVVYPTLMERGDWTINQMLNEHDEWRLIAVSKSTG